MNGKTSFWGLRLKKQLIILGLLGLSFLAGCATPSSSPLRLDGCGSGCGPRGRPGGRHQSHESLEGRGYRRLARSWPGVD